MIHPQRLVLSFAQPEPNPRPDPDPGGDGEC